MKLALIGAGASSVCLLDALAESAGPSGAITIYERSTDLWRGRPYQQDAPAVKVNAPPEEMSVRAGDTAHFRRWLDEFGGHDSAHDEADPWCGTRYTSRSLYGDYLVHCAESAIERLRRRGWRVDLVFGTVTAAHRVGERVEIRVDGGRTRVVDYAVLCVGGGRPHDGYGLAGSPGFVADPYPTSRSFDEIDADDRVAVLGTGLTAVDTGTRRERTPWPDIHAFPQWHAACRPPATRSTRAQALHARIHAWLGPARPTSELDGADRADARRVARGRRGPVDDVRRGPDPGCGGSDSTPATALRGRREP